MTGIRQSMIFAMEGVDANGNSNFGKGKGNHPTGSVGSITYVANSWISPPPGTFFSSTASRSTSRLDAMGCKTFDEIAFGHFSGTWEWSFNMDYAYLEPFLLAFEDYTPPSGDGTHVFKKVNNKRIPSFVVRRKILNVIAGGPSGSDEVTELTGCVVKSIKFSRSASNSQTSVSMSGVYVNQRTVLGSLSATDYAEYTGDLAEFSCLFFGTAVDANYVGNTDSLSLGVENNASTVGNVCSPFSASYAEGKTNYSWTMSCYSNNPANIKLRSYTGGYNKIDWGARIGPLSKNLAPIPLINIVSYNKSVNDGDAATIEDAIAASTKTIDFEITKAYVKSLSWQKGDGSKLQDQFSSVECKGLTLTIKNGSNDDLSTTPSHTVVSDDPTA